MRLIVESPAPDLKNNLLYYKRLGFQCVEWEDVYLCQTKQLCILLNPDPYSRPCINLFGVQTQKTELSPSGTRIKQHKKKVEIPQVELKSLFGNYSGVCLETLDLNASYHFWQAKGFKGSLAAQATWCSLKHESGAVINLLKANHCPHLFFNPSLAFFNGKKNSAVIKQIKTLQIPIQQEVIFDKETHADNLVLSDPGGIGFFIFND